jgi:hypothetical protein
MLCPADVGEGSITTSSVSAVDSPRTPSVATGTTGAPSR